MMEIRTERLTLRPVTADDLETTHAYSSVLENTRLMMFLPNDTLEETAAQISKSVEEWGKERPELWDFAIVMDGAHIGGITVYALERPDEVELGWILHRDFWGRGIVAEAAAALIGYARDVLGARRIIAMCDSENVGSYRVMEKLGMRRVSCSGGRKNRSSSEERMELLYEIRF